ncbi:MAG: hypothetical protein GC136_01075 [Alphaproteobacteria bacterium]|nr:hypothetical protein [Alphaproteobacteria bacterium]
MAVDPAAAQNIDALTKSVRELAAHNAQLDIHLERLLPLAGLQLLSVKADGLNAPNDAAFARLNVRNWFDNMAERGAVSRDAVEQAFKNNDHRRLFSELVAAANSLEYIPDDAVAAINTDDDIVTIKTPDDKKLHFRPKGVISSNINLSLFNYYAPLVMGQALSDNDAKLSRQDFVALLSARYLAAAHDYLGVNPLSSASPEDRQAGNKWAHLQEVASMVGLLDDAMRAEKTFNLPQLSAEERKARDDIWKFHDAQLLNLPRLHEKLPITVNGEKQSVSIMEVMLPAVNALLEKRDEPITDENGQPYTAQALATMAAYVMITDRMPKGDLYDSLRKLDKSRIDALRTWIFKQNHFALEYFTGVVDASYASSHHDTVSKEHGNISLLPADARGRDRLDALIGLTADRLAATGDAISADELLACFWRYGDKTYPDSGSDKLDPAIIRFMIESGTFDKWLTQSKAGGFYRVTGPDALPASKVATDLKHIINLTDEALSKAQANEEKAAKEEGRAAKT